MDRLPQPHRSRRHGKHARAARGTPIGANDASIAGHAIAAGAVLVTNNSREFGRVAGLSFEDWAAPA
jgi:tRNA(fMet)-specific endonuclease VapC